MQIAVDAMGRRSRPAQVLQGASQAAAEYRIDVSVLASPRQFSRCSTSIRCSALFRARSRSRMDDHPAQAVRSKLTRR